MGELVRHSLYTPYGIIVVSQAVLDSLGLRPGQSISAAVADTARAAMLAEVTRKERSK